MISGVYTYRNLRDEYPSSPMTGTWFDNFPDGEVVVRSAMAPPPDRPASFTLDTDAYRIKAMADQHGNRNPRGHFFPDYEIEDIAKHLATADGQAYGQYAAAAVCLYSIARATQAKTIIPTAQAMVRISPTVEHLQPDLPPKRRGTPPPAPSADVPVRELHAVALNRPEPIQPGDLYAMGPTSLRVSLAAMTVWHAVRLLSPETVLQYAYRPPMGDLSSFPQQLAEAVGFEDSARLGPTPDQQFVIGRAVVGTTELEGSIAHTLGGYFEKHNVSVTNQA
jgi:hypothetical protein